MPIFLINFQHISIINVKSLFQLIQCESETICRWINFFTYNISNNRLNF